MNASFPERRDEFEVLMRAVIFRVRCGFATCTGPPVASALDTKTKELIALGLRRTQAPRKYSTFIGFLFCIGAKSPRILQNSANIAGREDVRSLGPCE